MALALRVKSLALALLHPALALMLLALLTSLQQFGGFVSRVSYQRSITIAKRPNGGFRAKFAVGVPVKGANISISCLFVLITKGERINT
jgi:hypothetical protein